MTAPTPGVFRTFVDYTDTSLGATLLGFKVPYLAGRWLQQGWKLSEPANKTVSLFKNSYYLMSFPSIPGNIRNIIKYSGELSFASPASAFWTGGRLFSSVDSLIGIRVGHLLEVWDSSISPIDEHFMEVFDRCSSVGFVLSTAFLVAEASADLHQYTTQEASDKTTNEVKSAKICLSLWKLAERIICFVMGIFIALKTLFFLPLSPSGY